MTRNEDRFAVYMGVGASPMIQTRLIDNGMSPNTPVTVVENASRRDQFTVQTTLDQLGHVVKTTPIKGPAVLMVGYSVNVTNVQHIDISKEAAE